jgi:lauroyl/myristoyl acyltransferase
MVIGVHFMSLELGGRITGLCQPMMAMYRPHNNQAQTVEQTRCLSGRSPDPARTRRLHPVSAPVPCRADRLQHAQSQQRGVMVIGVHFMSLELGGRITGLCQPLHRLIIVRAIHGHHWLAQSGNTAAQLQRHKVQAKRKR